MRFGSRARILPTALALLGLVAGCRKEPAAPPATQATPVPTFQVRQLTLSNGLDLNPSFSPNGKALAFSSDRSGRFEIYLKQLDRAGDERALTSDGEDNLQPTWSPDGELIAYHSGAKGGIFVMPASGGPARRVSKMGSKPAFSPDGKTLVFQSEPLVDFGPNAQPQSTSTLYMADLAGGEPRPLTERGRPAGGHGSPTYTPNGLQILFIVYDRRTSEIWSIDLPTKKLRRLVSGLRYAFEPVVSPDGSSVYFSSVSRSGAYEMKKLRLTQGQEVAGPGDLETVGGLGQGVARHLALDRPGRLVAYSALRLVSNLWTVPLDPRTGAPTGPPKALTNESGRNSRPLVSPDGKWIVYDKSWSGANRDVWLLSRDGKVARPLTSDPSVDESASWFPGSDRVAFLSNRRGHFALLSLGLDFSPAPVSATAPEPSPRGVDETILFDPGEGMEYARLSPDGRTIAYHARGADGAINVYVTGLGGGAATQLTFEKELAGYPAFSPDGKLLAVELKHGDHVQVGILPVSGGKITTLTEAAGQSWPHTFSPDGERIAFASFRDGLWNVEWVKHRTRERRFVTSNERRGVYLRYPAFSPDGQAIVYELAETAGNIWIAEGF
ncbi:MAG: PD40 domain-containing protein [Acidobacteria bacterium]|nr:PD40 domain-containing protein [Acidobacteriota bacterium]